MLVLLSIVPFPCFVSETVACGFPLPDLPPEAAARLCDLAPVQNESRGRARTGREETGTVPGPANPPMSSQDPTADVKASEQRLLLDIRDQGTKAEETGAEGTKAAIRDRATVTTGVFAELLRIAGRAVSKGHPPLSMDERSRRLTVTLTRNEAKVELKQVFFNTGKRPVAFRFALPLGRSDILLSCSVPARTLKGTDLLSAALVYAVSAGVPNLLSCCDGPVALTGPVTVAPHRPWVFRASWKSRALSPGGRRVFTIPHATRGPVSAPIRRIFVSIRTVGGLADRLQCLSHVLTPALPRSRWAYTAIRAHDCVPEEDIVLSLATDRKAPVLSAIASSDRDGIWIRADGFLPEKAVRKDSARKHGRTGGHGKGRSPSATGEKATPRAILFLADVSGSLYGPPLETLKKGLLDCLDSLDGNDVFNILSFSLIPRSFHHEFLKATDRAIEQGKKYIRSLRGHGGTNLGETIQQAAELMAAAPPGSSKRLIMYTDGKADVGIIETRRLLKLFRQMMPSDTRLEIVALGCNVDCRLLASMTRYRRGRLRFADSAEQACELLKTLLATTIPRYASIDVSARARGRSLDFRSNRSMASYSELPLVVAAHLQRQGPGTGSSPGKAGQNDDSAHGEDRRGNRVEIAYTARTGDGRVGAGTVDSPVVDLELPAGGIGENVKCFLVAPAVSVMVESVNRPESVPRLPLWQEARLRRILRIPSGGRERDRLGEIAESSGISVVDRHRMVQRLATDGTFLPRSFDTVRFRRAGRRIFSLVGGVDGLYWNEEGRPNTRKEVKVRYGSRRWLELAAGRPDLRPVLGLGRQLVFEDGGVTYVVHP